MSVKHSEMAGIEKGKRKVEDPSTREFDSLLHCPNIQVCPDLAATHHNADRAYQGVVIGVGLYMIEQAFLGGKGSLSNIPTPIQSHKSKKRKTSVAKADNTKSPHPASVSLIASDLSALDDEDDDMLDPEIFACQSDTGRVGAASARGTGYAGIANEDVGKDIKGKPRHR